VEEKIIAPNESKHALTCLLLISSWLEFLFVKVVPKYLKSVLNLPKYGGDDGIFKVKKQNRLEWENGK
jgi:hypothetical protein